MSLTMTTSLHGSTAFNSKKKGKKKGEKKEKGKKKKTFKKRWNSQNRFFQPRSGPFSTDRLKCWVIIRQPTSNIAWLRLIQSHSVYETQWYGHSTQHSSAFVKATQLDIMFRQKRTEQVQLLNWESLHFSCNVCLSLTGYFTFFLFFLENTSIVWLRGNVYCIVGKYHLISVFYLLSRAFRLRIRPSSTSVAAEAGDRFLNLKH